MLFIGLALGLEIALSLSNKWQGNIPTFSINFIVENPVQDSTFHPPACLVLPPPNSLLLVFGICCCLTTLFSRVGTDII